MSLNRTLAGLIDASGELTSGGGLDVYATLDNLPTTGLTSGDQAYVSATSRFYISNGSGWYNVALVNATPNLTISPSGAIELNTDGSTTTITLTATDSDYPDAALTFSVDSDGSFGGLGTISQDSSVFTITPFSRDSATTTSSTLTFKASDGISFGSGTRILSLEFSVANSNHTTLLLQAATGTDAQVDASSNSYTLTKYGTPVSTAASPYHPGGYSTYFDGTGDYLSIPDHNDLDFGSSDFTMECWIYVPDPSITVILMSKRASSSTYGATYIALVGGNAAASATSNNSSWDIIPVNSSFGAVSANTWTHLALVRDGNNFTGYVNGVGTSLGTSSSTIAANSSAVTIGGDTDGYQINGYIRDARWVKGTAVYTSNFTPPTKSLTAITNTVLLACHHPSATVDGSTNNHTMTIGGNTSTRRFGPYDYLGYTKTDHGGSVYFDGTADYYIAPFSITGVSNITVEAWIYMESISSHNVIYSQYPNANAGDYSGRHMFYIATQDSKLKYWVADDGTAEHSEVLKFNTWYHVAYVRDGNTIKLYVNGKGETSGITFDRAIYSENINLVAEPTNSNHFEGYVTDYRITYNSTTYTGDFTPTTAPLTSSSDTKLLTFTNKNDIWDTGTGKLLTKANNVTASNTQRKFATSSAIYFDGTDDFITVADSTDFDFGTGDFTMEGWYYATNVSGDRYLLNFTTSAGNGHFGVNFYNGGWRVGLFNGSLITGTTGIETNVWHHFAWVRASGVMKFYIDGTQVGSNVTYSSALDCSGTFRIGTYATTTTYGEYLGYMQDIRITKGLARYTGNFTPPTAEFSG